jgi:tetratricopeptide (TPR) repeat protein
MLLFGSFAKLMFRPHSPKAVRRRTRVTFTILAVVCVFAAAVFAQESPPVPAEEAVALFNQGQDAHAKGELTRAIEYYNQALRLVAEFPEAEFQKGAALTNLGDIKGAEASFRRAVELRPDWTLALASLGTLLVREGKLDEAETFLNKAIKLDEMSFPAYSGLVELQLAKDKDQNRSKVLLEKIRVFSSKASPTASIWTSQAMLENSLGDRAAARTSIARALAIDGLHKPALYLKAEIAIAEGDTTLAEDILNTLEKTDRDSEGVVMLRARLAASNGRFDEALRILAAIAEPSREARSLSEALSAVADQPPGDLEKKLEGQPRDALLLGRLCTAYRITDPNKALEYCKRAFDVEPANLAHAIGFGAALVSAGRYAEAVDVLRRLVQIAPENSSVHANLGTALFQLKRYEEAKSEYRWLTTRQPGLAAGYYFLAICHDQLKEYMDAAANYDLFLKLADASKNRLEIEKVNIRRPALQKLIKRTGGKS